MCQPIVEFNSKSRFEILDSRFCITGAVRQNTILVNVLHQIVFAGITKLSQNFIATQVVSYLFTYVFLFDEHEKLSVDEQAVTGWIRWDIIQCFIFICQDYNAIWKIQLLLKLKTNNNEILINASYSICFTYLHFAYK